MRNLLNGCRTFTEIRQGAAGISTWPHHLEPAYVLWGTTKLVDAAKLPDRTVVVRFDMQDRPDEHYWLLLRKPHPELCTRGIGYVEDVVARTDSACLVDIHLGRTTYADATRSGRLAFDGTPAMAQAFITWIRPSPYAGVPRGPVPAPAP